MRGAGEELAAPHPHDGLISCAASKIGSQDEQRVTDSCGSAK
jgi:hypothetical protein